MNNTAKVVGLIRWDQGGGVDDLVIVLNCSATTNTGYEMAFPSAGTWYCLYNSDSQAYDGSFGNVGPAVGDSVVAGATASLNLGAYSMQIYSKTRLPSPSATSFDPAMPSGCDTTTVDIVYTPADGPLQNVTNVYAYIGRNVWQSPSNVAMTASGDDWILTYPIPQDTYELNISFTDGAATNALWDNNGGANWSVPVSNCGDLPAEVSLSPVLPQGCVPLQITYEVNGGPLIGADQVYLFIGRNDWQNIQDAPLTLEGNDTWTGTYSIPDDTWQLDFVFHDSSNRWDNNGYQDWQVLVSDCVNPEQPHLSITSPAPNTTVASTTTVQSLQGTASLLAGPLHWTNTLSGGAGTTTISSNWSLSAVPLSEGVNLIRVSGTNSSVNPNDGAGDSPTNSTYASSSIWTNGQNGGSKFKAWSIGGGATASLAISNTNCSFATNSQAWALQADGGGFIRAIRPFAAALQPGDQVSFLFENGGVDGGLGSSSVGVAFENRFGQRLTEFKFEGGTTNYVLFDTATLETGIPWGDGPKACTFEMLSTLDYRLTVNGQPFDGTFADASEYAVSYVRFWNWNAGGGDGRKVFVGALSVTGTPLPVLTYSSEIAVTRSPNPLRVTETFESTPSGLVATLNNASGVSGNIWGAEEMVGDGWNWSPLSPADYTISNNTVTILPTVTNVIKIISIGTPGGI